MRISARMFFVVVVLIFLFSCYAGPYTLFENVVNDDPIADNELDNKLDVTQIAATATNYYITCGLLRAKPIAGGGWSTINLGGGFANTVAVRNTDVYVGVVYTNGTGRLYVYHEGTGIVDPPLTLPGVGADLNQVVKLKNVGGNIIASIRIQSTGLYTLYNVTAGSAIVSGIADPITDFTNNNYFVAGNNVYNGSGTVVSFADPVYIYSSIFDDGTAYYVGTANGILLRAAAPGPANWTASSAFTYTKGGKTMYVRFSDFEELDADTLAVATRGTGFYAIDTTEAFPAGITRFSDATKRELFEGAVEDIFNDAGKVFFCTMGAGLWNNEWASGSGWGETWTRE